MVIFVVIYATTETKKTRENQITHYEDTTITMGLVTENYLGYTFVEIPVSDEGGYFIDSPSVEFSVNKDCKNLDMTNEFMRFLFQPEELKNMAYLKGLISPTKDHTFGAVYDSFSEIPGERTFSPEELGVKDSMFKKIL